MTSSISRLRLAHLGVELLVQAAAEGFLALAQRVFALTHARTGRFELLALARGEAMLVFDGAHVAIDLREMLRELRLARAQIFARACDDGRVQTETAGDLERQAPPWRPINELIGRRKRLGIEAERCAGDAIRRRRVGLELVVMARRDEGGAPLAEMIDDGDAERAALDRIGTGSDFVEENQRGRHERSVHRHDVRDMAGERAEARINRLLVADVGEQRLKYRHARAIRGGNTQPRLSHQRQQPRGLERDSLAAGVRAGNQQDGRRRNHLDRDRHGPRKQRMPRGQQLEVAVSRQHRFDAVDRLRKSCACLHDVELAGGLNRLRDVFGPAAKGVGQSQQDAQDLFVLLLLERNDVVVDLDRAERFEKEARAAGGRSVNDAGNGAYGVRTSRPGHTGHSVR